MLNRKYFSKKKIGIALIGLLFSLSPALYGQNILIHSHNDYNRRVPFYQAYAQQVASIEVDVFMGSQKGELLVAHNKEDLGKAPRIEDAYIGPIVNLFKQNGGKAWKGSDKNLTLLVDLKSAANPTLDILIAKLKAHPTVFDPAVNPNAVRVVISGNRPDPKDFAKYPSFISFDGSHTNYSPDELKRIAMISLPFKEFTKWNGKGAIVKPEREKLEKTIKEVHDLNKPIRFWGTPDGVTAWNTYYTLGIDYINTDRPEACTDYFSNFANKNYNIALSTKQEGEDEVAQAKRLDKVTSGFEGFRNKGLQLTKRIDVYKPTYLNDGSNKPVRNIILLIGDGMGINQISSAETVNNGLSLFQLKHIGLQITEAKDSYTTDSAAGGSALATGEKGNNRHISMTEDGQVIPSITDVLHPHGIACGVVTLGNAADATPAAFYGHSTERDNSDEITNYLLDGKLTILSGSDMGLFTKRDDKRNLAEELTAKAGYQISSNINDIKEDKSKIICIDERMGKAATEETLDLLAQATRNSIKKLSKASDKGFFLMVEAAKIDYAGHANSLPGSIVETLSFDLAIAEALKFADSNDETLVIVTGDHETGGLTLIDGNRSKGLITARFVTDDHTPAMLPVFAYGPGANLFNGVYQNTEIFHKMRKLLGY